MKNQELSTYEGRRTAFTRHPHIYLVFLFGMSTFFPIMRSLVREEKKYLSRFQNIKRKTWNYPLEEGRESFKVPFTNFTFAFSFSPFFFYPLHPVLFEGEEESWVENSCVTLISA